MSGGREGYRAALEGLAVRDRSDRGLLRISGRAPGRMLHGILTSTIPGPEERVSSDVRAGRAFYSTLLTPKGRMVGDLRVFRADAGAPGEGEEAEEFLLDVAPAATRGVVEHFGRFLPPRFARVDDLSAEWAVLGVVGPAAFGAAALHGAGLRVGEEELAALEEDAYLAVATGPGTFLRIVGTREVAAPAVDLVGDARTVGGVRRALVGAGAVELGPEEWDVLRVEAGRPVFGQDMDEDTIPVEAGLGLRAIDHEKGCYTGQEVIVRIRDRGHVNRSLRGIRLGARELPEPGTPLYAPDARGDREAGVLTTVVESPRMGPVALGYVRREVGPGGEVRVGSVDGPAAEVVELGPAWGPEGAGG